MKNSRQSEIVQFLDAEGMLTVTELGKRFGVSEMTVRRDLVELETAGLVRRVHGGATRALGRAYEPPFRMRQAAALGSKQAIARAAAKLIAEGDAIGLDVGSTVLEMVPEFVDIDNLTVVTASLRVANRVAELHALEHSVRLIVTGGVARAEELSLTGQSAIEFYRNIRLDKAFISVGGVSNEGGATEFNLEDAEVKRALINSSEEVVVLADSSKFGQTGFAYVADLRRVSCLITDSGIGEKVLSDLRGIGVSVTVVDPV
ncbi:DeoR/GlpR family DNA-binding transcription regulator [Subtercola sp. PAMC28395]|uniref:DeoR/GlpR family DNA-binding transcription regulator n=1 Tax=Subtercola sp. PAMC28395 TaxID=2846775 RepID=UPI001C0DA80E|nr:DeoR/GlpR family DNA-binding transcription regulator [Subtercola sp. PAMC28395]QWT24171.1 DeoR/GlpR family DNA-binding transcription regulator [Subtercola sp. PAMC28395]